MDLKIEEWGREVVERLVEHEGSKNSQVSEGRREVSKRSRTCWERI